METNMTQKERLLKVIEALGMSVRAFEDSCGLSQAAIPHFGDNVPPKSLSKILAAYPEISRTYILIGSGSMFADNTITIDASGDHISTGDINGGNNNFGSGSHTIAPQQPGNDMTYAQQLIITQQKLIAQQEKNIELLERLAKQ